MTNRSGSFLAIPSRIAIAGDWHADTASGAAAIRHAGKRNANATLGLTNATLGLTNAPTVD